MVTDGASESRRMKIHVHISFQWGWTRILSWTRVLSHYNFISSFAVRARVIFCLSSRWTRGEAGRSRLMGHRLVDCWLLRMLARAGPWSPVSCTMGRCVVCLFTVCSTSRIRVLDPRCFWWRLWWWWWWWRLCCQSCGCCRRGWRCCSVSPL